MAFLAENKQNLMVSIVLSLELVSYKTDNTEQNHPQIKCSQVLDTFCSWQEVKYFPPSLSAELGIHFVLLASWMNALAFLVSAIRLFSVLFVEMT